MAWACIPSFQAQAREVQSQPEQHSKVLFQNNKVKGRWVSKMLVLQAQDLTSVPKTQVCVWGRELGVVVGACNLITEEMDSGRSLSNIYQPPEPNW